MKLNAKLLQSVLATYVDENKISVATFSETRANSVGLLDTIGKIFTITHNYVDKLEELDGEFLSFGKTIEEWANDLILPEDYRPNGENAMSPHELTYRPVYFSYTLGRKVIPLTIRNNDLERAVHNEGQFVELISGKTKALADSKTMMRYGIKRQLLGVLASMCEDLQDITQATAYATLTAFSVGDTAYNNTDVYLVVKPISATNTLTLAQAIEQGYLIPVDLVKEVAIPVDASTGEKFVEEVKKDVEIASDFSEGHSLNGATLGASPEDGLRLYIKQGIMPNLEVKTLAGAFHEDKVAIPTQVKVLPDFGDADSDIYAILVDVRGVKCHPTYDAVRENFNGDGDFLNMFSHYECTAFVSRNVFVRIYKVPQA